MKPSMPRKISTENKYAALTSKVSSYIQAVEEGEDSQYHLRYLQSLKKQIEKKMEETTEELRPELQAVYDLLETFLPYHERGI